MTLMKMMVMMMILKMKLINSLNGWSVELRICADCMGKELTAERPDVRLGSR